MPLSVSVPLLRGSGRGNTQVRQPERQLTAVNRGQNKFKSRKKKMQVDRQKEGVGDRAGKADRQTGGRADRGDRQLLRAC